MGLNKILIKKSGVKSVLLDYILQILN